MGRQAGRQAGGQAGRRTSRQAGGQVGGQMKQAGCYGFPSPVYEKSKSEEAQKAGYPVRSARMSWVKGAGTDYVACLEAQPF